MIGVAPVIRSSLRPSPIRPIAFRSALGEAAVALEDDHRRDLFAAAAWLCCERVERAGRFRVLRAGSCSGRRR